MYPWPGLAFGKSFKPPAHRILLRTSSHGPFSVLSLAITLTRSCTARRRWTAVPGYSESYISDSGGISFASADVSLHSPAGASLLSDSAAVDLCASRVVAEMTNNDGLEV